MAAADRMTFPRAISSMLVAALLLVGCGGDDESAEEPVTGDDATTAEEVPAPEAEAPGDLDSKPQVEPPDGPPPESLESEDLVAGEGGAAAAGDLLAVQYVGVLYETGEEFDSSWERDEPYTFQLGAGMVIPGWDEGLEGLRVGGRRMLTIPPDLAYGARGAPPDIGPDETLVFVIDLIGLQ